MLGGGLRDPGGRLESRQAGELRAVTVQRNRWRLAQAQATEKVLAQRFQLHLQQRDPGRLRHRGKLPQ